MHPFALLPMALAAGRGRVDGLESAAVVAAGFTLLQRCAPLVRALAGRHSAIALPPSASFVTALAASEGRAALVLDPRQPSEVLERTLAERGVGALFTDESTAERLTGQIPLVILSDALTTARVVLPDGRSLMIDLGSHFGLTLEGETEVEGSPEPCLIISSGAHADRTVTHREVLALARSALKSQPVATGSSVRAAPSWADLDALIESGIAPLVAGAHLATRG